MIHLYVNPESNDMERYGNLAVLFFFFLNIFPITTKFDLVALLAGYLVTNAFYWK